MIAALLSRWLGIFVIERQYIVPMLCVVGLTQYIALQEFVDSYEVNFSA